MTSFENFLDISTACIFFRLVLDSSFIKLNYRKVVQRSSFWEGSRQNEALRTITQWSIFTLILSVINILSIALPLQCISRILNDKSARIIEAVSKILASICVLQISLKSPTWFGIYPKKFRDVEVGISLRQIKLNLSWNLWRLVVECGFFLVPLSLLDGGIIFIPVSAGMGIIVALIIASIAHFWSSRFRIQLLLTTFITPLSALYATGLFVEGCHLLELIFHTTNTIWKLEKPFWNENAYPMLILKQFGYSSSWTTLQLCTFGIWTLITLALHFRTYRLGMIRRNVLIDDTDVTQRTEHTSDSDSLPSLDSEMEDSDLIIENCISDTGCTIEIDMGGE